MLLCEEKAISDGFVGNDIKILVLFSKRFDARELTPCLD